MNVLGFFSVLVIIKHQMCFSCREFLTSRNLGGGAGAERQCDNDSSPGMGFRDSLSTK